MSSIILEIFIVLGLTLLNGFFSMSEIALVTIRKTRVSQLARQGSRKAKVLEVLHKNPETLFATIQIGISIITIVASAYAGSRLASDLALQLKKIDFQPLAENAFIFSFILLVGFVSYFNLVIGELVPKSLGLRYSENLALLAAYPIFWLSKLSYPLIKLLSFSSNLILKPFNDRTSFRESRISEEEIRQLISEAQRTGAVEAHEHRIIENVFESSDLTAEKIMVPRTQMVAFEVSLPAEEIIKKSIASGYSRVPVYEGDINNIAGILYTKKILGNFGQGTENINIKEYLLPAYFVPSAMRIGDVLRRLQRKKIHMAMVTDEHGEIEGLVTLEDILEEIVGDIKDETDEASKNITAQEDGSWLVLGEVSVVDFNKYLKAGLPENAGFTTVSGFILQQLGRFAKEGDIVKCDDLQITVKEKDLRTVKLAVVKRIN